MKNSRKYTLYAVLAATAAAGCLSCNDDYDLDEKLPPNFGSNLMSYLEENNYTNYARLAKDLNYEEALSGVALKTLLAANDEAYEKFFKGNPWGVKSYEELTLAQKKMLFYGSMLDNSLQVLNLSSTSGTNEATAGNAMRRAGSGSVYDSVPVILPEEMPELNTNWDFYRNTGKKIVCMKDMTSQPILFFIEPYLQSKRITNEDINFLYNNEIDRQTGDATVGNTFIAEGNLRLPNGFIHRTNDVLLPLDNMAEILRKKSNTTIYSRILERFSAPFYAGEEATRAYNLEYGTEIDSLFVKQYFAERSTGGKPNITRPNNGPEVDSYLRFDPGWNSFFSDQKGAVSQTVAMQSNMGVMLVPSDKAMQEYWNGSGAIIKDYYHEIDSVPNHIWAELINNGMLNSWVNSVPSKFDGIVNSNQDRMGIKVKDVDSVYLACNGAIYLTNKVFAPTSFISVSFPSLVNETMNIWRWAIQRLEYRSYLNSLDSYYSFFIPTNKALTLYYDPVSYPGTSNKVWRFHYNEKALSEDERVWATVYAYDMDNDVIGDSIGEVRDPYVIADRLEDLLDTHIIVGNKDLGSNVENGHQFYRTKNGGVIAVRPGANGNIEVQGTLQRDRDKWLKVTKVYDQTLSGGNGKTYIIDGDEGEEDIQPIMTTRNSSIDVMSQHDEFSVFFDLFNGCQALQETKRNGTFDAGSAAGNISTFNNFNYTIYVPTNESMNKVLADKATYGLYTWEEIAMMEAKNDNNPSDELQQSIDIAKETLEAFLRYHIQDNLLLIGLDYANDGAADYDEHGNLTIGDTFTRKYETAYMDATTQKFRTVEVHSTPTSLMVKDLAGNERHVLQQTDTEGNPLWNLTSRDYLLVGAGNITGTISASSFAAIHLIDGPLLFK